jgi:hypothetical protein
MAVWYSLWSFVIFFPIWYVWTKKNLATLVTPREEAGFGQTGFELRALTGLKLLNCVRFDCV